MSEIIESLNLEKKPNLPTPKPLPRRIPDTVPKRRIPIPERRDIPNPKIEPSKGDPPGLL